MIRWPIRRKFKIDMELGYSKIRPANAPYHVVIAAVRHDTIRSRLPLEELRLISADDRPVLIDVKLMYDRADAERSGFVYWEL